MVNEDYADEHYTDILKRIDSKKSYSQHDIDALSRKIIVSGNGNVVQIGGQNINIQNNSGTIYTGNNVIYQGISAAALNKAIAQAIAMHRLHFGVPDPQAQDDGLVPFKFYFIFIWMLTSLLIVSGFVYLFVKNNYLYVAPSISISQYILQLSFAFFINQLFFGSIKYIYEAYRKNLQWTEVKYPYSYWFIYPVIVMLEFSFFTIKIVIKIFCDINNNNKKNDIFSPFKWF